MAEDDWEAIQFLGNDLLKIIHEKLEGLDLFGIFTAPFQILELTAFLQWERRADFRWRIGPIQHGMDL